jgi:hypothetical protein
MSSLQAFYSGAFSQTPSQLTLAQVLSNGNVANLNIDMNQLDLVNVDSITNATAPVKLTAPAGLSLSGSLGTAGDVLSSNGAAQPTWISNTTTAPTLDQVLAQGATASIPIVSSVNITCLDLIATDDVIATGDVTGANLTASATVTAVTVNASGNMSCVDLTSTSDIFAVTITNSAPLNPTYTSLSFPTPAGSVGTVVSQSESTGFPLAPFAGGSWNPFPNPIFTSAVVLPLGIYMFSCVTQFIGTALGQCQIGVRNDATLLQPPVGSYGGFYSASGGQPTVTFTTFFVSETGFQSPQFLAWTDTPGAVISVLEWTATKIG